jgi:aminoglycoside phosphotransferase (APT) family kinase protein
VIIDWTAAAKGDPMADVARTWLLCTLLLHPLLRRLFNPWLKYFYTEYLKEYTRLAGISRERLALWKIPIIAARLHEETEDARKVFLLSVLEKELAKPRVM